MKTSNNSSRKNNSLINNFYLPSYEISSNSDEEDEESIKFNNLVDETIDEDWVNILSLIPVTILNFKQTNESYEKVKGLNLVLEVSDQNKKSMWTKGWENEWVQFSKETYEKDRKLIKEQEKKKKELEKEKQKEKEKEKQKEKETETETEKETEIKTEKEKEPKTKTETETKKEQDNEKEKLKQTNKPTTKIKPKPIPRPKTQAKMSIGDSGFVPKRTLYQRIGKKDNPKNEPTKEFKRKQQKISKSYFTPKTRSRNEKNEIHQPIKLKNLSLHNSFVFNDNILSAIQILETSCRSDLNHLEETPTLNIKQGIGSHTLISDQLLKLENLILDKNTLNTINNFMNSNKGDDENLMMKGEKGIGKENENQNQTERKDLERLDSLQLKEYAKEHFSQSKGGILKRKQLTLKELMSHSPNKIQTSITKLSKNKLNKIAIESFKHLLCYMGEPKWVKKFTKKQLKTRELVQIDSMKRILNIGLDHKELRDEIYLQICKQITDNPNPHSNLRGWGALCLISQTFPPSGQLQNYLLKILNYYINKKSEKDRSQSISEYASFSKHKLKILFEKKSGFSIVSDRMIQRIFDVPYDPIVFHVTLEQCMKVQEKRWPNEKIPHVLSFLIEKIEESGGFGKEGLFRVPGNAKKISELKELIDSGEYTSTDQQMNTSFCYASLLKTWLREIQNPLVPFNTVNKIINSTREHEMVQIAENLPTLNKYCLAYLINFARKMADPNVVMKTKMETQSLVLMMSPNIVRVKEQTIQIMVQITAKRNLFLMSLIKNWEVSKILLLIEQGKNK
ncbi:rho gtpase activation protein [Anaeramoeba flamelloides]|uniref:Rho gtpase activation protein n=1 Tax=Anaeramoeba flamelloides TaxID=1746091 RepID=A0ABQ8YKA0_9EUKA|nr:rho gtpase activation protein [Anaeramoeba flamelloides]